MLKRLHAVPDKRERKDACRPHGRLLAKIASGNPLLPLEVIVQQVGGWVEAASGSCCCVMTLLKCMYVHVCDDLDLQRHSSVGSCFLHSGSAALPLEAVVQEAHLLGPWRGTV